MQESCQEQEMYQRDNRQKEVRKREKENGRGRDRGIHREGEATWKPQGEAWGQWQPCFSQTHTFHFINMCWVCTMRDEAALSFEFAHVWLRVCVSHVELEPGDSWTYLSVRLQGPRDRRREQNSPGDINVQKIMLLHRQPLGHGRTLQMCACVCACVGACACVWEKEKEITN